MKKSLLTLGMVLLPGLAAAQVSKLDPTLQHMFNTSNKAQSTYSATASTQTAHILITTSDISVVGNIIEKAGYEFMVITDNMMTTNVPTSFVATLAQLEEVEHIAGSNNLSLYNNLAIKSTGVDRIHKGTGLETPYTGKGVLIGVIDAGFEFQHVAFLDSEQKSRLHSVWNRVNKEQPTTKIPNDGEADSNGGHGTHVASIAAGSKVEGISTYGMAPEAKLIFVPSALEDNEVLEDIAYIQRTAKELGMPYVINMSFGGQIGPHDGSSSYSVGLNNLADKGAILVKAVGNDGDSDIHTNHTFSEDGEVRYVFFKDPANGVNYLNLWEQTGNETAPLTIEPCIYSETKKTVVVGSSNFNRMGLSLTEGIDAKNGKQFAIINNSVETMKKYIGDNSAIFGLKITGKAGSSFHLWTMLGDIYRPTSFTTAGISASQVLSANPNYTVSDQASTKNVVAVGSYNTGKYNWTTLSGESLMLSRYSEANALSVFSNIGPCLTPGEIKPTVVAPGALINAAFNQYSTAFDGDVKNDSYATEKKTISTPHPFIPGLTSNKDYYYGLNAGTSMAAPAVTGIIALWLEANPELTYEQIFQILKETSSQDEYTAKGGIDAWGYGKINAYSGLKKALELANSSGINDVLNSDAPISIMANDEACNVLFNNNETFANIRVCDLNGRIVELRKLQSVKRGQEENVSLAGLPTGVYLINIETTKSTMTRKMIVK